MNNRHNRHHRHSSYDSHSNSSRSPSPSSVFSSASETCILSPAQLLRPTSRHNRFTLSPSSSAPRPSPPASSPKPPPPKFSPLPPLPLPVAEEVLATHQMPKEVGSPPQLRTVACSPFSQVALQTLQIPVPFRSMLRPTHLHQLDHLCAMHNILQNQLVDTEKKRQQVVEEALSYEQGVAEAIRQIHSLRHHVAECLKVASGDKLPPKDPKREDLQANSSYCFLI